MINKLMKRTSILTALFSLATSWVMAQSSLSTTNIPVSTEPLNFNVQEFDAPDYCVTVFCDKDCKNIGFESYDKDPKTNKKVQLVINVKRVSDGQQLYTKEFKYAKYFALGANSIAEYDQYGTSIFHLETGAELFKKKYNYLGVIGDNIILSAGNGVTSNIKVCAYSMTTGEELWKQPIIGQAGLTYNQPIDEKSDYLVCNDLYRINWETGETMKLDSKTHITNKGALFGQVLAGVAMGAMTGYAIIPTTRKSISLTDRKFFFWPQNDKIAGLNSNILSKDNLNYFADRNSIRCFDDNFNEKWNTELTEKATRSEIFLKGDNLVMINYAIGFYGNGGYKQREKPYIAIFDAKDGKQLRTEKINSENQYVSSTTLIGNKLHLFIGDQEGTYDLASNTMDYALPDTTVAGRYISYVNEHSYFCKNADNTFSSIKSTDDTRLAVTNKGSIVDIKSPKAKVIYSPKEYYNVAAYYDDMVFLLKNRKSLEPTELWCIKDGKATLVSNNVLFVKKATNHLAVVLDNNKVQVLTLR